LKEQIPDKQPKTQHSRIYDKDEKTENRFVVLDNPDDRISKETGNGVTMVANDNPDDVESQ